ncbi:MAG: hypothetical protein IIB29_06710 [Chloroflexi bacterium]|nr:hypothetical protein [Chloroflexota bacterium]
MDLTAEEVERFSGYQGACLVCSLPGSVGSGDDPVAMWSITAPANTSRRDGTHLEFICQDRDKCRRHKIERLWDRN